MPRRVLITAGEVSGDLLGAEIMAALKGRGDYIFYGVGGEKMKAAGLREIFPMQDIAVMGIVEVLPAILRVLRRLKEVLRWVEAERPDIVITVDAQDFSARLRARVRQAMPELPLVQVSSPTVWAWREGRVKALARDTDMVLCLFPFEVDFLAARGVKGVYIGHPAVEKLAGKASGKSRKFEVALLPGSRTGEVKRHWPVLLATYVRLKKLLPQLSGVLVVPNARIAALCAHDGMDLQVVEGEARFERLAQVKLALAKSGTNNLEMALLGTPAVVGYRMAPLTYRIAKWLVRTPRVSLPNIILGRTVYPEFIQHAFTEENLGRAAYALLQDDKAWQRQADALESLRDIMSVKKPSGVVAAEVVEGLLRQG